MASIKLKNVCKSYGGHEVTRNVSFDIEDGEFVVLVGPSGCGKSTMIRMIAGLEDITSGEILIDDEVINSVPAKDRDIAMVFQSYALYPHMNVEQNMGFSLRIEGRPKDEIRRLVAETAEALELTPLLRRKPGQLSGGQRQRSLWGVPSFEIHASFSLMSPCRIWMPSCASRCVQKLLRCRKNIKQQRFM